MTAPLLQTVGLTKAYSNFTLRDLSISIEPGQTCGLVGTNGAGKTTLIKCILGLTRHDSGTLSLFGQDCPKGASAALREQIGVVFDTCLLPKSYSPADVERLMKISYQAFDRADYHNYLRVLGIEGFRKVEDLSRGMSMKLSIACALSHAPRLLLLDEATAGLDPMVREEVLDVIRQHMLERECGALMCSHITSDLEKIADTIVCLDAGRVAFSCERDVICDQAGIARCRGGELEQILQEDQELSGQAHIERGAYGVNLLVPDRFAFARRHPEVPCDRCTIEDYMRIYLKGETR